jgi:hypothetical protein
MTSVLTVMLWITRRLSGWRRSASSVALAVLALACLGSPSSPVAGSTGASAGALASGPAGDRLPAVRGVYGHDSTYDSARPATTGFALIRRSGFNVVQTDAYRDSLDALQAAGLMGIVWLGGYANATCSFEHGDAWVRQHVAEIAGHPAILAYYIADEPLVSRCPHAPADLRERTALVHALDRRARTFTVIQAWDPAIGGSPYAQWQDSGAVDVWGFDVYPCRRSPYSCDFTKIDQARRLIEGIGLTPYLAVIQDFQDCHYGLPANDDLRKQFLHWQRSRMTGYLVFSWDYTSAEPGCARYAAPVEQAAGNVQEFARENALPMGPQLTASSP